MDFMSQLMERAKRSPKTIIFPESCEARVLQAAKKVLDLGIAEPYLVGSSTDIIPVAAQAGVDLSGFTVLNNGTESARESLTQAYLAVSDEFSEKTLMRKFKNPLNYAAAMVKCKKADCLAAGYTYPTGDVIYAAQVFIGMAPDISTVSSLGVVEFPGFETSEGNLLTITDCAVCPAPDSSELADIAITSADTMRKLLGWDPRVAMLSFSTKGSAEHTAVEKVREAVLMANKRRPDLKIDGEFQLDAAIVLAVAKKKVGDGSEVAGKANIIVFPDLSAGNIGVKLIQIFGNALAYGPIMQGFAHPVTDFSRSAPLDEIVGNLAMLVVLANRTEGAR